MNMARTAESIASCNPSPGNGAGASSILQNERGSVLIVSLLLLALLTVVGIAATRTAQVEQRLSGNEKHHKMAFYAAEAAVGYAANTPALYGPLNMNGDDPASFPNLADDSEIYSLNAEQGFNGSVQFLGASAPPRGSGTQIGAFTAYRYRMTCVGHGPAGAESRIETGFYRLGQ